MLLCFFLSFLRYLSTILPSPSPSSVYIYTSSGRCSCCLTASHTYFPLACRAVVPFYGLDARRSVIERATSGLASFIGRIYFFFGFSFDFEYYCVVLGLQKEKQKKGVGVLCLVLLYK